MNVVYYEWKLIAAARKYSDGIMILLTGFNRQNYDIRFTVATWTFFDRWKSVSIDGMKEKNN